MKYSFVPCPHCGEEIRSDAKFCRHCGSSDSDGWREESDWEEDAEDDFDYEEFVADHFEVGSTNTRTAPAWRLVAVILLILFALGFLLW